MGAKHTPGPWRLDEMRMRIFEVNDACEVLAFSFGREADARLAAAAPELHDAAEATLLFHSGGDWDEAKGARWAALTGVHDATTKVLCDFVRHCMAKARGES